ncbi:MAG: DNA primase family protein [Solirubrobacteraceae bacterium]
MSRPQRAPLIAENGAAPFPLTDLGNAERLVAAHGQDVRYVAGIGWHVWTGARWESDETGELPRRAKLTARAILHDAANCDDSDERKAIVKWATVSESEPRLRATVALAASEQAVVARANELDAHPMLLNVANGTLDLSTGRLRAFERNDLITLQTAVAFEPDASCPRWERFVAEIFAGDVELIAFMQRLVGYCLTGDTREEVLTVLEGVGCNGKSTLVAALKALLGPYAVTAPFDTFMRARGDRGPRNDLARLRYARLVTASESGAGRSLDEATVKEITGGDTIAARFLYGEHFEYAPQFKLMLVTNHRPRVDGADEALWRRLRLVPFTESFEGRQDRGLADTLEHELPGILNWALRGCLDWQRDGLGDAAAAQSATTEYRQDEDVLGAFLDERCTLDGEADRTELRDAYTAYCQEIGETPLAANVLGRQLARRGISKNKRKGLYVGVKLG